MTKIIRTHSLRLLLLTCLVAWAGSSFGQVTKDQELARIQKNRAEKKVSPQVLSKSVNGATFTLSPEQFPTRISPLSAVPQGATKVEIPLPQAIRLSRSSLSLPTMKASPIPLNSYKKETLKTISKRTRVD